MRTLILSIFGALLVFFLGFSAAKLSHEEPFPQVEEDLYVNVIVSIMVGNMDLAAEGNTEQLKQWNCALLEGYIGRIDPTLYESEGRRQDIERMKERAEAWVKEMKGRGRCHI